jgi:hypothetical protein
LGENLVADRTAEFQVVHAAAFGTVDDRLTVSGAFRHHRIAKVPTFVERYEVQLRPQFVPAHALTTLVTDPAATGTHPHIRKRADLYALLHVDAHDLDGTTLHQLSGDAVVVPLYSPWFERPKYTAGDRSVLDR